MKEGGVVVLFLHVDRYHLRSLSACFILALLGLLVSGCSQDARHADDVNAAPAIHEQPQII